MTGPDEHTFDRRLAWLLAGTLAAAAYAALVASTGGFDGHLGGIRVRSRDWSRPAAAAAIGAAWLVYATRRPLAARSARAWHRADTITGSRVLVGAATTWTLAAALIFGTFAIGGADSYGYAGQARLLRHGRVTDTIPLKPGFRWPDARASLIPLGFTGGREPAVIAPIYPPGFPLLMAAFALISERAIYLVVPLFGVVVVWGTYRLGVDLGQPLGGGIAALALSVSPTFLYQLVQPMGDIPAAGCWLGALLAASRQTTVSAGGAGLLAALAIAIRPNLAPLAGLIVLPVITAEGAGRRQRLAAFTLGLAPGIIALGWIQHIRYGSAFASGYGRIEDGFSPGNVLPNLARYPKWLTETHTPFIWLSVLAPAWILASRRQARPHLAWTSVALALAVWAAYLPYVYFQPQEWFYTRFLLPAIAIMLLFASVLTLSGVRRLPTAVRLPVGVTLLAMLIAASLVAARSRQVFELQDQERKYRDAGAFASEHLQTNAFVLAGQHSGSLRYYADRPTLRWDVLGPGHLDEALADLRSEGYQPFAVLDAEEDREFRAKFGGAGQQAIDRLTPLAVLGPVRIYSFGH
jgi:hypothetical protein